MIHNFTKKDQMEKDICSDRDFTKGEAAQERSQLKNGAAQEARAAPTDGPWSWTAGSGLASGLMLAMELAEDWL